MLISPGPGKHFSLSDFFGLYIKILVVKKKKKITTLLKLIGTPQDSGISLQTVLELGPRVPLFGVCMGLQCIGEAFGG